jgi:hypothetical protein
MIKLVAMGPHEAKDPSRELDLGVQIVSRPPDQILNSALALLTDRAQELAAWRCN